MPRSDRRSADGTAAFADLARWILIIAVVALPLAVDLGNVDDTYYGAKARTLFILTAALTVSGVGRLLLGARPHPRPFSAAGAGFAVAASLATALGVDPRWSVWGSPLRHEGMVALIGYAVLGIAATALQRRWSERWWKALLVSAAIVACYAVLQDFGLELIVRDPRRARLTEAFATMGNPNWLAALMVLALPVALGAWLHTSAAGRRLVLGAVIAMLYWALLASFSFSGWIAGWLAAALSLGLGMRIRKGRALLAGLGLAVLTVAFFARPRPGLSPDLDFRVQAEAAVEVGSVSWQPRLLLWRETLPLIARRPVLGYGPDAFSLVFPQEWTEARRRFLGDAPLRIDRAHNDLLDVAMSSGLLGAASLVTAVLIALWTVGGAMRRDPSDQILSGVFGSLVGFSLLMQVHFGSVGVTPIFWMLMGFGVARAERAG